MRDQRIIQPSADLARTLEAQARASDPDASAWVAANAGAGKTHVLKMRVLRLLLAGVAPERILCLTYTKAAAAEMAARVFGELGAWATADDQKLRGSIGDLTGNTAVSADLLVAARRLFARAIETPGGLKVQTIHAFCERLLQRFPLEAGVPPGFTILDDQAADELFEIALTDVLDQAVRQPGSALADALGRLIVHATGDALERLIRHAVGRRDWLRMIADLDPRAGERNRQLRELYAGSLDLDPAATVESLEREAATVLDDRTIARAAEVLRATEGKLDSELADGLAAARVALDPARRRQALEAALLTAEKAPRADGRFVSKAARLADPGLADRLMAARDRLADLSVAIDAVGMVEATVALATVAGAVMDRYGAAKARRAALDFEDLISKCAALLSVSKAADWVLFKLDGGLDHVLVDEAQDTAPDQWRVIEALVAEFFAGEGRERPGRDGKGREGRGRGGTAPARTVFAVGDEKQSIYSFQGAAPEMFARIGDRFERRAGEIGQPWHRVPLTLSFRTVEPVLQAVDAVLSDPVRTPGVVAPGRALVHLAKRIGEAGRVEVWPLEVPAETLAEDPFEPGHHAAEPSPAERLAARIADLIGHWIRSGERLPSLNRPIEPRDIMILVARRRPFADVMVSALKARGIPVAGADRMQLGDQLVVKDLLALGHALALPEDDLALAAVLKSPLFDLTDDDLIALAPKRAGSLYSAVMRAGEQSLWYAAIAGRLRRWRALADLKPPFEFLTRVLDEDGMRERLIARLGPEAIDPIDELLAAALADDDQAPASLQGFLTRMSGSARVVKRDMEPGRDQVRVLTVHGSKGLEAPIVFLPDTCASGAGARVPLVPLDRETMARVWPADVPPAYIWALKGAARVAAAGLARQAVLQAEREERNRLLYVAMTRARDRLYVAGFEGRRARATGCWYDAVTEGLAPLLVDALDGFGRSIKRIECHQSVPVAPASAPVPPRAPVGPSPAWTKSRAPREERATIPLVPSRLAPLEIDAEGEPLDRPPSVSGAPPVPPIEPAAPSPAQLSGEYRFLRGRLTHGLLELLPAIEPARRHGVAERFVEIRGQGLPARVHASIVAETLAVLSDPRFAPVFGPGSRAEVPIVAEVPDPCGRRLPLRIVGQIDRILVTPARVLMVDFKSNRPPPGTTAEVPLAYLLQLAAYRLALQHVYRDVPVNAALLWTDGPRLMPIPDEDLNGQTSQLWEPKKEPRA